MDINSIGSRPTRDDVGAEQVGARRVERAADQSAQRAEAERTPGGDTLEISDRARELARARQAAEDAPDVRADKVAAIKQQIEDGAYSVSPEALAQKLLESQNRGGS